MSKKSKHEVRRAVDTAVVAIAVIILAFALWLLLDGIVGAQGPCPVYPHVEWGSGPVPWHYYAPGYRVRAACFNNYGAHVPCQPVITYTVWR